jgi:bla regulator protein blaR1
VSQASALDWSSLLLWAWLAGALATALVFVLAHRRYVHSLGRLTGADGLFIAATSDQGPALLGLWRPSIVLPADFASRYAPDEQSLIIVHERQHALRRDPLANACIALLQCGFWFNPLVHIAAARCRFDQELACDADVMERHPGRSRAYAAAMLKTQVGGVLAPVTCHWQSSHPLKERIMQLNKHTRNPWRRAAGRSLLAIVVAAGVLGTVAARAEPAKAHKYLVDFKMTVAGEYSTPTVLVAAGEPFTLTGAREGKTWSGDFLVTEGKDGQIWLKSQFSFDGKKGGTHNAGMRLGERQHLAIMDDFGKGTMVMVIDEGVTLAPQSPAP